MAPSAATMWSLLATFLISDTASRTRAMAGCDFQPNAFARKRDLVIEGLTTPTGIGDIRMAPRRIDGYDVVELEIRSDGGSAVLEVDRDLLAQFVDSTLEIVDLGEEHDHLDLDGAIARLTGSAAGPTTP